MSKRKTARPRARAISPVSIYGEVYDGKGLRKKCVLSLEWQREGVIDGDRGGDACWKEWFVILRDEEVGGLDMMTTDEDTVLRGDWTVTR